MISPLRISMVTAGLTDAHAGTTYVVTSLARRLAEFGAAVTVHTAETDMTAALPDITPAIRRPTRLLTFGGHKLIAPAMGRALRAEPADWIHVHGFWLHPFVVGCLAGRATGARVLLSPHGMFSNFSFTAKGARKKITLRLGFLAALRRVDAFHATSLAEREEIRQLGLTQPVHVIANGVDLPLQLPKKLAGGARTLLFLSRIHPKKGLFNLLAAWETVAAARNDWQLLIAGPDEGGHLVELKRLVTERGLERVRFSGPCYGDKRNAAMRAASLFVLPSLDENFGLVVAEAMANGTPVLTTTRTPWQEIEANGCGWCVAPTVESLTQGLLAATALDAVSLAGMGQRGRDHMAVHYSWDKIVRRFAADIFARPAAGAAWN